MNDGERSMKNRFTSSLIMLGAGMALALIGAFCYFTGNELYNRFADWAGILIICGIIDLCRYFYWTRPQRRDKYVKRLHDENIHARDERTQAIYGRMGHIMYILTILILAVFLSVAVIIEFEYPEIEVPYFAILVVFLFFELIGGWFLYHYFNKKL